MLYLESYHFDTTLEVFKHYFFMIKLLQYINILTFGLCRKNLVANVHSYLIKEIGFLRLARVANSPIDMRDSTWFSYDHIRGWSYSILNHFFFPQFDQGISCADVADICVKALHDSTARNKSFDVRLQLNLVWFFIRVVGWISRTFYLFIYYYCYFFFGYLCRYVMNMLLSRERNCMNW